MALRLRAGVVFLFSLFACRAATGSSILVRSSSPSAPDSLSVSTYAGRTGVSISAVDPDSSLTVVLLVDGLSPAMLQSIDKDLLELYRSLNGHPLRLALLRGGSVNVAGPFTSRARLKIALEKNQFVAGPSAPVAAPAFFDAMVAASPQWGANWSRVLLIGGFPSLDPAVQEYASAVLLKAFTSAHLQVSWFSPAGVDDAWLPVFQATGGTIVRGGFVDFPRTIGGPSQSFFQVDWLPAAPPSGFVVFRSVISGHSDGALEVPDIAAQPGTALPSIERYAAMRARIASAAQIAENPLTEANARQIREDLQAAMEVNPLDPDALFTSAVLNEKLKNFSAAATFRALLVEVRPLDSAAYAALGHDLLLSSALDKAEEALKRATDLSTLTPQVAEDLACIHLARKDDKGALPYLGEALRADAKRQDLWFLQAHAAEQAGDSSLAIQSFESGLALGGPHVTEAGSLLRLYLTARQNTKAQDLAKSVIAMLPPDPAIRTGFADTLDELRLVTAALAAWRRVLEVQLGSGRAHYRIARLLLESSDARAAELAADRGLEVAPKFAGLYIVKADALEKQGQIYNARETLEQGAASVPDHALLSRLATVEDAYGGSPADAYARLAESLDASSPERLHALERGFSVSLRDADLEHARSFAGMLESAGRSEFRSLLSIEEPADSGTWVPGGLAALAFAAHAREGVPPERFFSEYSRTLVDRMCLHSTCPRDQYVEDIQEHFQRIQALESFGRRDGNRVVISLSLSGKDARRNTERVLGILGLKLRLLKGRVELDRGEKKDQARKQQTSSALALDEGGIQEALQTGKPYTFEIPYEWAAVYPSEKLWRETFYSSETAPGGFATALLRLPKMASLYVGISSLDRKTAFELLSSLTLKTLYDRYADRIYLFAPALAVQGTHAAVPGGSKAEPIWTTLTGANPAQPGAFFRALLERDNGRLLAFFFALSQIDRAHQSFFTANPSRTTNFYKLFVESEEMRRGVSAAMSDSPFTQFLRSVPLDAEGHVDFPGSAEVWTVARGHSSSDSQTAKMLKKVSKAVAPDLEDAVLLRLAQTHYKERARRHTELENFLAVARIDAHRPEPLDEEAALLLAQEYSDFSSAYPYFSDITALQASDYRRFFVAIDHVKAHSLVDANGELGQFHSLIEWICLLRRRQVFGDADAAKLFRFVCDRFADATAGAAYTAASLESARTILGHCKTPEKASSFDEQLRVCLLGSDPQVASHRTVEFQRVLELQKVPSLDAMFSIYAGVAGLTANRSNGLAAIEKGAAGLPSLEVPKGTRIVGKEKENIVRYDSAPIRVLVGQLRQKASKNKPNTKDIDKLSQELLAELRPQVTVGLAGPVYAYFQRPSDLVVSEDPLLLRKHRYFDFASETAHNEITPESEFRAENQGLGSYFVGGFAQFGPASGVAAARGSKSGPRPGLGAVAAQIAAVRSTAWDQLGESDQHLVSLRTTVAREWIGESARHAEVFQALSEETMGLLSLTRRADLLNGIESRNWRKVWDSVTLPDLFMLGGRYLDRFKNDPWSSPVTAALRSLSVANDGSRLYILGAITYHSFGCGHPHLMPDAPYEEYEHHKLPDEIAERAAEFKLFLVFQADRLGVAPPSLSSVAEPLALKAFRSAQMTDFHDWRSLLVAFASITPGDIKQALEQ